MTILNLTNDGYPNVLAAILRAISQLGGTIPRNQLAELMTPSTLEYRGGDKKGEDFVTKTLRTWLGFGLFVEDDTGIRLAPAHRAQLATVNSQALGSVLRGILLSERHCLPLWQDGERARGRSGDLGAALAWLLSVDGVVGSGFGGVEQRKSTTLKAGSEGLLLSGQARWSGLRAWARNLGFGWETPGGFLPDPSPAIRDVLPDVLLGSSDVDAATFAGELAQAIPVLDGGSVRLELEPSLLQEYRLGKGSQRLSPSLSRALLRLRAEGLLQWERRSDAELRLLLPGGNSRPIEVSHFRRGDRHDA